MSYRLHVKEGNLVLEHDSTFIVNASNTALILGSGVSMAFENHCGPKLQQEMSDTLKALNKKLRKGDVILTSSANAKNFKFALHACIMDYNPGVNHNTSLPTLDTIKKALFNIQLHLHEYHNIEKKKIKLVLPLMGCGVGRLNKNDVIKIYKDFFIQDVDFECEVVFYAHNESDYKKLLDSIY